MISLLWSTALSYQTTRYSYSSKQQHRHQVLFPNQPPYYFPTNAISQSQPYTIHNWVCIPHGVNWDIHCHFYRYWDEVFYSNISLLVTNMDTFLLYDNEMLFLSCGRMISSDWVWLLCPDQPLNPDWFISPLDYR